MSRLVPDVSFRFRCPASAEGDDLQPTTPGFALLFVQRVQLTTLNMKDHADVAEHEGAKSSTEDTPRGMSRGTNHCTPEVTEDAEGEEKAQVGRWKASAVTSSTGLRRRERRFESCRGHHV